MCSSTSCERDHRLAVAVLEGHAAPQDRRVRSVLYSVAERVALLGCSVVVHDAAIAIETRCGYLITYAQRSRTWLIEVI